MKCPYCGAELYWQQSYNACELCDDYDDDDPSIVDCYLCSHCGRDFEIYEPSMKEKKHKVQKILV